MLVINPSRYLRSDGTGNAFDLKKESSDHSKQEADKEGSLSFLLQK